MGLNHFDWICSKDYLPENGNNCLIYDGKDLVWTGFYDHSEKEWKSTFKLDAHCGFYYKDIPQDWYVYWRLA